MIVMNLTLGLLGNNLLNLLNLVDCAVFIASSAKLEMFIIAVVQPILKNYSLTHYLRLPIVWVCARLGSYWKMARIGPFEGAGRTCCHQSLQIRRWMSLPVLLPRSVL